MKARPLRVLLMLLPAALLALPVPARAEAAAQAWGLPQLLHEFAQVKSSRAHFTERKYLHMLKRPLQDSGIMIYEAPARLLKQTQQPKPERFLIDGDTITIDRDSREQTLNRNDYPQLWAFIEGMRATLAGDLSALEAVYTVQLDGGPSDWQMSLQPRDRQMQEMVQSIRISGSKAHITRIETLEHDGDRTEVTIVEDGG